MSADAIETVSLAGGSSSPGVVQLQLRWLQYKFTGTFLVMDSGYGVIGRNILNRLRITYDGPQLNWDVA